jgi:hypothetical protein
MTPLPPAPPGDTTKCPYCGAPTEIQPATRVYGDAGKAWGLVLVCSKYPVCDAYVGIHKHTHIPKGTLADHKLRYWRKRAHIEFDKLWSRGNPDSRRAAYARLEQILGVEPGMGHIGWCSVELCKVVIDALSSPLTAPEPKP